MLTNFVSQLFKHNSDIEVGKKNLTGKFKVQSSLVCVQLMQAWYSYKKKKKCYGVQCTN